MKILVRSEYLFNGYSVEENIDLSIVDGLVKYGKVTEKYDLVFEAKYVLPALIDGHLHLVFDIRPKIYSRSIRNVANLFIIHGVLGVRDTGNWLGTGELFNSFSKLPLIKTTYVIEKPPLNWPFMRPVFSLDDLEVHVKRAVIEGCNWFKLYVNVDEELVDRSIDLAHSHGLKVTGHVNNIGVWKAIEKGFDCIEHLDSIGRVKPGVRPIEAWEEIGEGEIEEIARSMARRNICLVPTLSVYRAAIGRLAIDKRKYSRYVMPWYKWMGRARVKEYRRIYDKLVKALRILWENKVKIVAGTDLPNFALNPGISLWEEIYGYVEAGIDLWDALRTATSNSSEILGFNIGVIRENNIANMLLFNEKPLENRKVVPEKIIYGENVFEAEKLLRELVKLPLFRY